MDSRLYCVLMLAGYHSITADEAQLRHEFGGGEFDDRAMLLAFRKLGMSARKLRQPADRLDKAPLPAVAFDQQGEAFIVARLAKDPEGNTRVLTQRPGSPPEVLSLEDFLRRWSGEMVFVTSRASLLGDLAHFDFSWFIPAVVRYRRLLGEVLLISFVLQIIGLVTPMFFQVIVDKVLVNHTMKTLNVIAVGLVIATLFEALLGGIRTWVFAHTSSKLDVELGARAFSHLLGLPIAYFQSRRVGDSVARIRELENIRQFLTGNAVTVLLDVFFSVIYFAVMYYYSPKLTVIVALSIPVYVLISLIFTPMLRARLDEKFNRGAENQAFLVESLTGIDTLKALAVEPRWKQRWDKQLSSYVTAGLATNNVGTVANGLVMLVSKLVTAAVMWVGATLVIDDQLTVGQLVAFNMLAGQVSSPILRLAQLWNDFQQVGISMKRLGDVLNARQEATSSRGRLPRIEGSIELDQLRFRYRPDAPEVIRGMSLRVNAGEVIGIVGRSGSGKSTLTRLIQRLYVPEQGRVMIDGHDLATIDASSLRQQIGVVLQENMLFNRTIRENIALVEPGLPLEAVIQAAQLAGAHEFICELPEGYDTLVGEHGTGLSGGQRQRIAIARALIRNPRILIFDEATSALDYESERIVQDNMRKICAGRTVLIIAHRLSAVRDANRIIVMERGQIQEMGSHAELMRQPNGLYAYLHSLQGGAGTAGARA